MLLNLQTDLFWLNKHGPAPGAQFSPAGSHLRLLRTHSSYSKLPADFPSVNIFSGIFGASWFLGKHCCLPVDLGLC